MGLSNNGKKDGWTYHTKSIKKNIENNQFVRKIRNQLMKEKLRKYFQNKV